MVWECERLTICCKESRSHGIDSLEYSAPRLTSALVSLQNAIAPIYCNRPIYCFTISTRILWLMVSYRIPTAVQFTFSLSQEVPNLTIRCNRILTLWTFGKLNSKPSVSLSAYNVILKNDSWILFFQSYIVASYYVSQCHKYWFWV
jgi:hypothetical protein